MTEVVKPMNAPDMLDYALGRLEGPAREQAEREIAGDPDLAEILDRLGRAVHQLLDDGDAKTLEPPEGLALQTLARSMRRVARRRTVLDYVPATVPFRWADLAVAAGILLAGLLTLVPAVRCSKIGMDQAGCVFNLQQLGLGLAQYAIQHHHYPYAPPDHPAAASGCFAVLLHDAGLLPDPATLDCPCNGTPARAAALPSVETLCELQRKSPGASPGCSAGTTPTTSAAGTGRGSPARSPPGSRRACRCWPTSRHTRASGSWPATAPTTAAGARTSSFPTATSAGTPLGASAPTTPTCSSTPSTGPARRRHPGRRPGAQPLPLRPVMGEGICHRPSCPRSRSQRRRASIVLASSIRPSWTIPRPRPRRR